MYLEWVNLNARRETTFTFVASAIPIVLPADATRVTLRALWQNPAAIGAANQGSVSVLGKNNVGTANQLTIIGLTQFQQWGEITAETHGDLVTKQFRIDPQGSPSDIIVIETFIRR